MALGQSAAESDQVLAKLTLRAPIPKRFSSWDSVERASLDGTVLLLTSTELKIRIQRADGSSLERKFDSRQIETYQPVWGTPDAKEAIALVESRQFEKAIPAIDKAIKSGIPFWQQQVAIGRLVESLDALGRTKSAATIFLNLAGSKPPYFIYADMPLCWRGEEPSRQLKEESVKWLASNDAHAQLIGASWLLFDPQNGTSAKQVLERLTASENAAIASYAAAQLWRLTPPPDTLKRSKSWLDYRERMLLPLQLGPTEFLADRFTRVGAKDLAIGELLRIASMKNTRYHRARVALESAEKLIRLKHPKEADLVLEWLKDLEQ